MIEGCMTRGYETMGLDIRKPKEPQKIQFLHGDMCDDHTLSDVLRAKPQVIVHMAAKARFRDGLTEPLDTYMTNVIGTLKLLETAKNIPQLEYFVYVSSEQAYGAAEYFPIDEEHPLRPYNLYGASKAAADTMVQNYCQSLPILILRPGMGYGPRSSPDQVVTKFLLKGIRKEPIFFDPRVRADPRLSPTRDCNYISNAIDGFILAIEKRPKPGSIYNIGSDSEVSILELATKVAELTGGEIVFSDEYVERPGELGRRFLLDIKKARKELGYEPRVSLREGLKMTFDWLMKNPTYFD
jgi:dTDP-glucose 4,6-dehydratase